MSAGYPGTCPMEQEMDSLKQFATFYAPAVIQACVQLSRSPTSWNEMTRVMMWAMMMIVRCQVTLRERKSPHSHVGEADARGDDERA